MEESRYVKAVFSLPAGSTKRIKIIKKLKPFYGSQEDIQAYIDGSLKFKNGKIVKVDDKYYLSPAQVTVEGKGQACRRVVSVTLNNDIL